MIKKKQFLGVPFPGILHQKAQEVDYISTRGIKFTRPERFIVNTPVGQHEIGAGDWVVEFPGNRLYVIKDKDIDALDFNEKKWWQIWL